MADSQDAIELKRRARRRLVGAIALVVFVVIALPIVLDREPKPVSQDLSIQIPSQDAGKFSSRVLPAEPPPPPTIAPEAAAVAAAPKAEASKVEAPKAEAAKSEAPKVVARPADTKLAESKPAAAAAKPETSALKAALSEVKAEAKAAAPETKAEAKPAPAQKPAATAAAKEAPAKEAPKAAVAETKAGESYFVPLGMFSKADNIKQVRGKAGSAGFKTFTEPVAGSDNVRVRAGPFATRDAAEKARDKLKGAGLDVGAVAVK